MKLDSEYFGFWGVGRFSVDLAKDHIEVRPSGRV
jgi:hypothetical protein